MRKSLSRLFKRRELTSMEKGKNFFPVEMRKKRELFSVCGGKEFSAWGGVRPREERWVGVAFLGDLVSGGPRADVAKRGGGLSQSGDRSHTQYLKEGSTFPRTKRRRKKDFDENAEKGLYREEKGGEKYIIHQRRGACPFLVKEKIGRKRSTEGRRVMVNYVSTSKKIILPIIPADVRKNN